MNNGIFWLHDPTILFKNGNYVNLFFKKYKNNIDILNIITLFSFYNILLLLLLSDGKKQNFIFFITIILSCIFLYYIYFYKINQNNNNLIKLPTSNIIKNNIIQNNIRYPTKNNPFMNPTTFIDKKKAAELDDKIIEKMDNYYEKDLYMRLDDLYDKKNKIRNFYTVPGDSVPNDQQKFASFLYNPKLLINCKDNQKDCIKYTDVNRFRHI
jgi:hypothetical protein